MPTAATRSTACRAGTYTLVAWVRGRGARHQDDHRHTGRRARLEADLRAAMTLLLVAHQPHLPRQRAAGRDHHRRRGLFRRRARRRGEAEAELQRGLDRRGHPGRRSSERTLVAQLRADRAADRRPAEAERRGRDQRPGYGAADCRRLPASGRRRSARRHRPHRCRARARRRDRRAEPLAPPRSRQRAVGQGGAGASGRIRRRPPGRHRADRRWPRPHRRSARHAEPRRSASTTALAAQFKR